MSKRKNRVKIDNLVNVTRLTEMKKLAISLAVAGIPFQLTRQDEYLGYSVQIWYPSREKSVCDVICHKYSYGYHDGLLEIMGLSDNYDGVEGWLTAEQVFERIHEHYIKEGYKNEGR